MHFIEPEDISDSESSSGGVDLPLEAFEEDISAKDRIHKLPRNVKTLRAIRIHYLPRLSRRQRCQIGSRLCELSSAFDTVDLSKGTDEGTALGYTVEPVPKLRAQIPDALLYTEDMIERGCPVRGWSDMSTLNRFLFRFEEYFSCDELIKGLNKSILVTIAKVDRVTRQITISEQYAANLYFLYNHDLFPEAFDEHGERRTRASFLESHFEPFAADITHTLSRAAADIEALRPCLTTLKSYAELLSVPSSEIQRLHWKHREQLNAYMVKVDEEIAHRARHYGLLVLYAVQLELRRERFLMTEKSVLDGLNRMMADAVRVRVFMAEIRGWVEEGGRVGWVHGMVERAREKVVSGGWMGCGNRF
ncbi:hypothetical protein EJ05DRAFT_495647 [Pseudovirgaria hyperparasitica]|uniref:Uncharacterized protein n=1 Tax=Pseudovirgaria hyperparasitica TaxID=470096 RepID=A0A6A6WKT4_9PEZI|nr:uncharacterized protein EJ05DRAFT_495647 [Pseudovirgaria hyperparasitica]KAF2762787.1 hypothetical protein EJ05DRAFT_495647 [Pseudovirgaria hyperparasitica]